VNTATALTRELAAPAPDTGKGDTIDRLAALYQQARLRTRRAQGVLAEAVNAHDRVGVRAALARYRRARYWEVLLRDLYLRTVLAAYR
jgi:hypothetical protein